VVSGGPFKVRRIGGWPAVEGRPRRRVHPPHALTPRSGHRDDPRLEQPAALDPQQAIVMTRSRLQPSVQPSRIRFRVSDLDALVT
jgi:hypothetical protein